MSTHSFLDFISGRVKVTTDYLSNAVLLRLSGQTKRMERLKDSCEGERCFLIGNAPSLTFDDLRKLQGEKTFGCNSLCLAFKELGFSTTYFFFGNWEVYTKHKEIIDSMKLENVFYRSHFFCMMERLPVWEKSIPFNYYPHLNYEGGKVRKFSEKPYKKVYDGYTIVYVMMQVAVFMGFKEIYILGVDCDYSHGKNNNHFAGSESEKVSDRLANWGNRKMSEGFERAREYAEGHGIRIYNCSRGGKLEVFERKDLDEVLGGRC